jgi:hypothetical protein
MQRFADLLGEPQMSVVNRVEGTAKNSYRATHVDGPLQIWSEASNRNARQTRERQLIRVSNNHFASNSREVNR